MNCFKIYPKNLHLCLVNFKRMKLFKVFILLIVMASCTTKEKADLIISGAKVYTVDEEFSTAEAFAVKDGKVVAVGSLQEIRDKYEADNYCDVLLKLHKSHRCFPCPVNRHIASNSPHNRKNGNVHR